MGNAENSALPQMSHRAQIANPFRAMVFGAMADEMIAAGTDVVKLSLGEPDFGAPPAVRDAMREQYDGRPLPYTAAMGLPELRQAISDFYKERHHVDVDPKRIAITAGGSTALLLAAALTVNEGDEVLVLDPSWVSYEPIIQAAGGVTVKVKLDYKQDYHITAALRLIVLPLILYVLLLPLHLDPAVWSTLYLLTAMPCGTLSAMQAELYGGDARFAARAIAYSTLLSLVTVPLISMLL